MEVGQDNGSSWERQKTEIVFGERTVWQNQRHVEYQDEHDVWEFQEKTNPLMNGLRINSDKS